MLQGLNNENLLCFNRVPIILVVKHSYIYIYPRVVNSLSFNSSPFQLLDQDQDNNNLFDQFLP